MSSKNNKFLWILLGSLIALSSWAQTPPSNNPYSRATPMPPAKLVAGTGPSLENVLTHYITHTYPGKVGSDPGLLLSNYIDGYTNLSSIPNNQKFLALKYFEFGDLRVQAAIARAMAAGVPITIITDFNQGMVGTNFPNSTDDSSDFEHVTYKNNGMGAFLQWLKAQGFALKEGVGNYTLLSGVLLTNPSKGDSEVALMHDKVATAKGYKYSINGSYNPSRTEIQSQDGKTWDGRYNSIYLLSDPVIANLDMDHFQLEAQEYNQRTGQGVTWDGPYRVTYPDGTFYELAFTDKKYNPNDRIDEMLTNAADPANKIVVKRIIKSLFVETEIGEDTALKNLLVAQPDTQLFAVYDQTAIPLTSYNESGAIEGYLVQRPEGSPLFPFSDKLRVDSKGQPRMELYGYQRLLDGVSTVHVGGEGDDIGDIHIWHDKTSIIEQTEIDPQSGQPTDWIYVFTRSFNNSDHFQSIESQAMIRLRGDSPAAAEIIAAVVQTARSETQFAIDLNVAIVRDWLGSFTDHTLYDIDPQKQVVPVIAALDKKDYKTFATLVSQIASLPTKGDHQPNVSNVALHTRKMVDFLNWYQAQYAKSNPNPTNSLSSMGERAAVNIGVALATGNGLQLKSALDVLYYNPNRPAPQTLTLEQTAWTSGLKMPGKLPEPPPPNNNVKKMDATARPDQSTSERKDNDQKKSSKLNKARRSAAKSTLGSDCPTRLEKLSQRAPRSEN